MTTDTQEDDWKLSVEGVLARFAADLITSPDGFRLRKLGFRTDLKRTGQAILVEQAHFLDRVALRIDSGGACSFSVQATRIMLVFYSHGWSGIAEVRLGETLNEVDLFSERPTTRHFVSNLPKGFFGTIEIRSNGAKSMLSEGSEVWLQQAFLLSEGGE